MKSHTDGSLYAIFFVSLFRGSRGSKRGFGLVMGGK